MIKRVGNLPEETGYSQHSKESKRKHDWKQAKDPL